MNRTRGRPPHKPVEDNGKFFNFSVKLDKMLFTYIHGTDKERALMYEAFQAMARCADRELLRMLAKEEKENLNNGSDKV